MSMAALRRGRDRLLAGLRDRQPVPSPRTGLFLVRIPDRWSDHIRGRLWGRTRDR
jgi:hypothetical protein